MHCDMLKIQGGVAIVEKLNCAHKFAAVMSYSSAKASLSTRCDFYIPFLKQYCLFKINTFKRLKISQAHLLPHSTMQESADCTSALPC